MINYNNAKISNEINNRYIVLLEKVLVLLKVISQSGSIPSLSIDDIVFKNVKDINTYISNKDSIKIIINNGEKSTTRLI